jgi:DNA-binding NarL/FixJ family response regulator
MVITEALSGERAAATTERAAVALVDDHPLFRQGLGVVLGAEEGFELAGFAGNSADALELAKARPLALIVVDLLLPDATGASLASALKRAQPQCKILGLSMLGEPLRIAEMLRAGADGFALKSQPAPEIIGAMRAVLAGERYLPPSVDHDAILHLATSDDAWPLRRLTQREREIFDLLVRGQTNDDIAAALFIARRTVETHRQHIMKKLGARSLVELIRIGLRHGVVDAYA